MSPRLTRAEKGLLGEARDRARNDDSLGYMPYFASAFRDHTTGITPDEIAPSLDRRALAGGAGFGPCPAWERRGRLRPAPARRNKDSDGDFVVKPYLQLGDAPEPV